MGDLIINKKLVLILVASLVFFSILYYSIYYQQDFDQYLICQVESGTSSSLLIPEINKESDKEKLRVKNHLNSHMIDMKYWKPCNINPENDLKYDIELYENQINAISECAEIRKAFVRKKISKEKFLSRVTILKPRIEI